MKKWLPVVLAPAVLGGCSINNPPEKSAITAQQLVTTLIEAQVSPLKQAQNELAAVTRVKQTKAPGKQSISTSPSALAGQRLSVSMTALRFVGNAPPPSTLAGAGSASSLRDALRKIVPADWTLSFSQDLHPDEQIPQVWRGGVIWVDALNQLLEKQGKVGLIDSAVRRVSIANKTAAFKVATKIESKAVTPSGSPQSVTHGRNPFNGGKSADLKQAVAPATTTRTSKKATVVQQKQHWRIDAGNTLKDTLFNWAASEVCNQPGITHWTVAWLTPVNYRIDAPLHFEGSFRDALNSLFTLYGTAKVPLYAGIRPLQCVISVDDKEVH
ncbi:toxin co-regulated pilus biosynthesis Q family protein [Serratia ureilytica]|uniref:toxin co-regulated pilus biosynthesis Q family protein n=1 Tax=Serratia ureilytica TaxID=300181 RepID=UPI00254EF48F|nr:toxin co-regulated pilus biosynthesis Q family protein [Serratia ureilytica]